MTLRTCLTDEDGKIMRYEEGEDESEEFDRLPDELSVRALHMLDNDQLLVASTLTTKSTGELYLQQLTNICIYILVRTSPGCILTIS